VSAWRSALSPQRYGAHAGEQYQLQPLVDDYGEGAVLDWLRAGKVLVGCGYILLVSCSEACAW
jgi:hypothetical protein